MTAPNINNKLKVIPGARIRGIDWSSVTILCPPSWAVIPVLIIKPNAKEIEVSGIRYIQVCLSKEEQQQDACRLCCAKLDMRLCNVICPYCIQGWVFTKKG